MAYFYRLIAIAFLGISPIFALFLPLNAFASFPIPNSTTWLHREGAATPQATPALSADQGAARWQYVQRTFNGYPNCSTSASALTMDSAIVYRYNIVGSNCPGKSPSFLDGTSSQACPANSTLSGSSCTCNSGFSESGGTCKSTAVVDKESCDALAAGLNYLKAPLVHFGAVGLTACFGGFVMSGSGGAGGGGQSELYGPFSCSGASAEACAVTPKPSDITADCKDGTYPGVVNGVQVCSPPENTISAPEKITVTPPAAGASAPSIPDAPAGTESTEKSTICTGTTCTTKTIYRDGTGVSLGEKKEDKPITSFCQENPKAPGCKSVMDSTTFAGSCGSPPACTGDAIQCAAAKAVFATACVFDLQPNAESALYDAAKAVDSSNSVITPTAVSISSSMFNSSNILGAGSGCIADKNVTISGHSMTLPFSSICQYLEYIGFLNLAIAFVLAGRIVARG